MILKYVVASNVFANSLGFELPENSKTMSVLWNMCLNSCNGAGITAVTVTGGFQMSRL